MASLSEKNEILCNDEEGPFKFFTGKKIKYFYMPIQGAICYTALSVHVMCPSLMISEFRNKAILNTLLFETLLGTGLYFYSRQHLQRVSREKRIFFSAFGAFSFIMSSIQLWNTLRYLIPQNLALCAACGVGSGLTLMMLGRCYINYVDSECDY